MSKFVKGDIVWAQAKDDDIWPALITKMITEEVYKVSFYGEKTKAQICIKDLYPYEKFKQQFIPNKPKNKLIKALQVADKQLSKRKAQSPTEQYEEKSPLSQENQKKQHQAQLTQKPTNVLVEIPEVIIPEVEIELNPLKKLQCMLFSLLHNKTVDLEKQISQIVTFHRSLNVTAQQYFLSSVPGLFKLMQEAAKKQKQHLKVAELLQEQIQRIYDCVFSKMFNTKSLRDAAQSLAF